MYIRVWGKQDLSTKQQRPMSMYTHTHTHTHTHTFCGSIRCCKFFPPFFFLPIQFKVAEFVCWKLAGISRRCTTLNFFYFFLIFFVVAFFPPVLICFICRCLKPGGYSAAVCAQNKTGLLKNICFCRCLKPGGYFVAVSDVAHPDGKEIREFVFPHHLAASFHHSEPEPKPKAKTWNPIH